MSKHAHGKVRIGRGSADYLAIEAYYDEDSAWWPVATIELDDHGEEPTEEQEAIAQFIVTAWNTHDALLEACEVLYRELQEVIMNSYKWEIREMQPAMEQAKAAIAKATSKDE